MPDTLRYGLPHRRGDAANGVIPDGNGDAAGGEDVDRIV